MQSSFKTGDLVAVISEDKIIYTVLSVYGNGQHLICSYTDEEDTSKHELSIPAVALMKVRIQDKKECKTHQNA